MESYSIAHVVATASRCAVGLSAATAAAAVRARVSMLMEHPFLVDSNGERVVCAREPTIDPTITGTPRLIQLAANGLYEILSNLAAANALPANLHILIALPEPRPGFARHDAIEVQESVAAFLQRQVTSVRVSLIGEGHAGALLAIRAAVEQLAAGRAELILAGGIDSYLQPRTIEWLDGGQRLLRDNIRAGFPPGEGAAFVAIASEAACNRWGLQSLAVIRAVACSQELRDPNSEVGLLGEGLTEVVEITTRGLESPREMISDLYGDINGERARTDDWGFTLMRLASRFDDGTRYVSTVGQCGDVGAATPALGCVLAVDAWRVDRASGPRALVWAGSWSGLRAAAVLEKATA